jgi:hypothetical protein
VAGLLFIRVPAGSEVGTKEGCFLIIAVLKGQDILLLSRERQETAMVIIPN